MSNAPNFSVAGNHCANRAVIVDTFIVRHNIPNHTIDNIRVGNFGILLQQVTGITTKRKFITVNVNFFQSEQDLVCQLIPNITFCAICRGENKLEA